jgi:hypothetical protein
MNKIVETALKYVGEMETPNNSGFKNKEFEKKMFAVGFQRGHAWCNYFVELVYKESLPELVKKIDKLMSASTQQTWKNFEKSGLFEFEISNFPSEGDLVIWQSTSNKNLGHIGIVTKIIDNYNFESVEGNTNDKGGREGYIVAVKKRTTKDTKSLKLLGFIHYTGASNLKISLNQNTEAPSNKE